MAALRFALPSSSLNAAPRFYCWLLVKTLFDLWETELYDVGKVKQLNIELDNISSILSCQEGNKMEKEFKEFIEIGEKKAGKQTELAKILGTRDTTLRLAKSGKRGLSVDICIKLADYINENRLEVIAASNLVTEKDEEKRKIFESCFEKTNRAASFLIAVIFAAVISITSQNPANASTATISGAHSLYYVKFCLTIQ